MGAFNAMGGRNNLGEDGKVLCLDWSGTGVLREWTGVGMGMGREQRGGDWREE